MQLDPTVADGRSDLPGSRGQRLLQMLMTEARAKFKRRIAMP